MMAVSKELETEFFSLVQKPTERKQRTCLKCGREFKTTAYKRICSDCEKLNATFNWKAEGTI